MSDGSNVIKFNPSTYVDPPCEQVGIPKPSTRPHVFAIQTGGGVCLRIAYPHQPDEKGQLIDLDLTTQELSDIITACASALALRSRNT